MITQAKFFGGGIKENLGAHRVLVKDSKRVQHLNTTTGGLYIRLPNAITYRHCGGPMFFIGTPSENHLEIQDAAGNSLVTLIENQMATCVLVDNTTPAGVWMLRISKMLCENFFEKSEQFDNVAWTKTNSGIVNCLWPDPFGGDVACLLRDDNTAAVEHFISQQKNTGAKQYTFSVWARLATSHFLILQVDEIANCFAFFNLTPPGAIATTGAGCTAGIKSVVNSFYRCSITFNALAETETFKINVAQADNEFAFDGNSNHKIYIFGAQLEYNSPAGCYKRIE